MSKTFVFFKILPFTVIPDSVTLLMPGYVCVSGCMCTHESVWIRACICIYVRVCTRVWLWVDHWYVYVCICVCSYWDRDIFAEEPLIQPCGYKRCSDKSGGVTLKFYHHTLLGAWRHIQASKAKLATFVESDLKAPFSIATTPRCRGCYSIPWIALLFVWSLPYNSER